MQRAVAFPHRLLVDAEGKDLVELYEGNIPIIISAPHGGKLDIGGGRPADGCKCPDATSNECVTCGYCSPVPVRRGGNHEEDFWTVELSYAIRKACEQFCMSEGLLKRGSEGPVMRPFQLVARVHRKYCDLNRAAEKAYEDPSMAHYYNRYHNGISEFIQQARKLSPIGRVLLIDVHGQSYMKGHVLRGTQDGRTVAHLLKTAGLDALLGPASLLGYLHDHGVPVAPHTPPSTEANDPARPQEFKGFNGGHTVIHHGSHHAHGAEAIQIEVGLHYRKDATARQLFAEKLVEAMVAFANAYQLH